MREVGAADRNCVSSSNGRQANGQSRRYEDRGYIGKSGRNKDPTIAGRYNVGHTVRNTLQWFKDLELRRKLAIDGRRAVPMHSDLLTVGANRSDLLRLQGAEILTHNVLDRFSLPI